MSAPGKLVRSSRWKTGPSKGQRPLGSECCVAAGDSGREAYTAIAWGVGLSHERSDIAGATGGSEQGHYILRHTAVGGLTGARGVWPMRKSANLTSSQEP